jgi:hypothetical protein
MATAVGFLFHCCFERGFMHHHINTLSKLVCTRAWRGIAKNRQRLAGRWCRKIILTVYHPPVFELDGFALFQPLEQWTRAHAIGNQRRGVKRARFIMLFNAITVALNRVI